MKVRSRRALAIALGAWASLIAAAAPAAEEDAKALARRMLDATGVRGGFVVHVGCGDGRLTAALRRSESFVVQGLDRSEANVRKARAHIQALGLYGPVSADVWRGERLPYAEGLVRLLVAEAPLPAGMDEPLRVLVPGGAAYVREGGKWTATLKPWPDAIDEWTHNAHGPDGNPVASDTVVGPPKHLRWIAGPRWLRAHDSDSSVNAVVTAAGRVFYLVDEAPISLTGQHALPDKWLLAARDAFSGVLLWKRPIEHWGWREWKKTWFKRRPGNMPINLHRRLVAVGESVYATLGYRAPISRLDAATGRTLGVYEGTERANEILVRGETLLMSMNTDDGVRIAAFNAETHRPLWKTAKAYAGTKQEVVMWPAKWGKDRVPELDAAVNLATDGRVVCFLDGTDVVCLGAAAGKPRWRATVPDKRGALYVGTLILRDGVVLHATPSRLVALSTETGKEMWSRPKTELGWLWFEWKDVFVVGDLVWTWSAELERKAYTMGKRRGRSAWPVSVNGYDLKTGELKKQVPLGGVFTAHHHHRCYRNKATSRYILASRRGTEFVDLLTGKHSVHNWVRGTCHLGMMPANGLQYAPPHPCRCYINEKLSGFIALAPEIPPEHRPKGPQPGDRLLRASAFGKTAGPAAGAEDWPTYRHDALRTGSASTAVGAKLARVWQAKPGGKLSSPVVAGGKVFIARADAHAVLAMGAADGRELWRFTAGGRIDSPPTYHRGALLFGSADGWVYCVGAADGKLAWRFRGAPADRRVGAFGQVESAWPVHGSVLVRGAVAYFAAGRSSYLDGGIHLYGLDAATGEQKHHALLTGPETDFSDREAHFRYGSGPGALSDILQADADGLYMRNHAFDFSLAEGKDSSKRIQAMGGFLDDTYFRRAFWYHGKTANRGRLIVHDDNGIYIVRMFRSMKMLTPDNFFTPGKDGYVLMAVRAAGSSPVAVANSASLNPVGKPLTVEAWVRAGAGDGAVLARGGVASGYALVLRGGRPQFVIRVKDKACAVTAKNPLALGRWAHLAGVLSEDKRLGIYVDGVLAGSTAAPSLLTAQPGQATEVGADVGTGAGEYESPFAFTGAIDEVRIHHRALTPGEIKARAGGAKSAPAKDGALVLAMSFDDGGVKDASGKGNHGKAGRINAVAGKVGRALEFAGNDKGWSKDIPVRVRAMVATEKLLFIAGPPDVLDAKDPLGAFEGRKGGLLWSVAADSGQRVSELRLESPPVFDGMAAASGRLYVTTRDGRLLCLAGAK